MSAQIPPTPGASGLNSRGERGVQECFTPCDRRASPGCVYKTSKGAGPFGNARGGVEAYRGRVRAPRARGPAAPSPARGWRPTALRTREHGFIALNPGSTVQSRGGHTQRAPRGVAVEAAEGKAGCAQGRAAFPSRLVPRSRVTKRRRSRAAVGDRGRTACERGASCANSLQVSWWEQGGRGTAQSGCRLGGRAGEPPPPQVQGHKQIHSSKVSPARPQLAKNGRRVLQNRGRGS